MIIIYIAMGSSILLGDTEDTKEVIVKEFIPAGRIEALIDNSHSDDYLLVQLDLILN